MGYEQVSNYQGFHQKAGVNKPGSRKGPAPHRSAPCHYILGLPAPGFWWSHYQGNRKGQYISNKRPSRFVILRSAQDDNPASASFDSQNVLFEMY